MEKIGADFKLAESRQVGKDISGQRFSGNGEKFCAIQAQAQGGLSELL